MSETPLHSSKKPLHAKKSHVKKFWRPKRFWPYVVLALVVWVGGAAALVSSAYADAKHGRDLLELARSSHSTESLRSGATDKQLHNASLALDRAHDKLSNPLVQPFRLLPVAGRQLSSAIALTDAASTLSDAAATALSEGRAIGDSDKQDRQVTLQRLAQITERAANRVQQVDLGPNRALVRQLAEVRDELAAELPGIRDGLTRASAAAHGASTLFDKQGTYLVIAANNAEMRAGSGMFLSVGTMKTGGGSISLGDMQTVGTVRTPEGSVTWPAEQKALWGWLGMHDDFRNLMLSPRFDVSAPLAAEVWKKAGKGDVDGVLVLDPEMLRSMLAATGPVQASGRSIGAGEVLNELMIEQYRKLDGTVGSQVSRRDVLSDVASGAFRELDSGSWDPITLARELSRAADGRHIMLWSKDPQLNDRWKTARVAGELDGNALMLNLVNVGGNKLDQFLKVEATAAQVTGRSGIDLSITVKVTNEAPSSAPRYVLGPFPGSDLKAGEYEGLLSLSVPLDASGLRFDGNQPLLASGKDGQSQVIATKFQLRQGESKTYVVRFTRNAVARSTTVYPSARIPATTWRYGADTWKDDHPHDIRH